MKRVLIVEGHRLFRQVLGIVLRHNTDLQETVEAGSLAEVRRTLGDPSHKPDIAVVDLELPDGEGFELIGELRARAPDVPVLGVTLRQDADRRERGLRAGAEEVLTMTASPKEIVDTAKRLIVGDRYPYPRGRSDTDKCAG